MVLDPASASRQVPDVGWPALIDVAVGPGGVRSHYQPVVDLARGTVVGYEALARFVPGGDQGPEHWFGAARYLGRLAELEAAALRAAFADRQDVPPDTFLAVNIGPDVLAHPLVREVLEDQGSLAGVVIELTEHARVDSYLLLEPSLNRLRSSGALIAIDDAGSGYSGLQHLLSIRPDVIKLDYSLVTGLDRDEAKRSLIEMVGTFASRVNAWVLAEGVETHSELEALARLGVPLAQGYYLGRPSEPWVEVADHIRDHLLSLATPGTGPTLRSLVESARTAFSASHAATAFAHDEVDIVVVLDRHGRPVATLEPRGLLQAVHDTNLQINLDTPVAQAAHRAITRSEGHRFDPLVCVDNAGRFVGLVRIERLLDFLATAAG